MTYRDNTGDAERRQMQPGSSRSFEPGLSRRAMITGMGTTLTTAALGVAIVPALAEAPAEGIAAKVDRLTAELSEAMREYGDGKFFAFVGPGEVGLHPHSQFRLTRVPKNPKERLERAIYEYRCAFEAVHDDVTGWYVAADMAIPVLKPVPVSWSGDGRYVVEEDGKWPAYFIERAPDLDKGGERWFVLSTGYHGPGEPPDQFLPESQLPRIDSKIREGRRA